jgi:regulatory protein
MPQITAIKTQQKRANRVSVYLDGRFAFGLNHKVAERFGLKPGMELSQAAIDAVVSGQVQQECLDKAILYLSRRMHSKKELRQKLVRAEFAADVIDKSLAKLEELGYVNDEEFARQKLQQAQRKLIGQRRAMAELMRSGVKGDVARDAVDQHFRSDEARDNAQKLIDKNLPRLERLDPDTAKRRLIGLLQRRGFDYETIMPLVRRAFGPDDFD